MRILLFKMHMYNAKRSHTNQFDDFILYCVLMIYLDQFISCLDELYW